MADKLHNCLRFNACVLTLDIGFKIVDFPLKRLLRVARCDFLSRICTAVSLHSKGLHTASSSALSTVVLVTFRAITAKLSSWGEKGGFQNFHPKKPNYLKLNETLLPESHRKQLLRPCLIVGCGDWQ